MAGRDVQIATEAPEMKSKLKFIVPVLLLVLGGAYKFVLAKPSAPAPKPKVDGQVYVLPKEFLINLNGGRFAKLSVGLVLDHSQATAEAGGEAAAKPPEGFGTLPQEAVIRDLVTDTLTDGSADNLVSEKGRERLKSRLLLSIKKKTDVKVEEVLFTDVAVQ
jgi:flagellar basal body-associated protein FliL